MAAQAGMEPGDENGVELPDLAAVRQIAMKALPAIAADEIPAGGNLHHYAVVVTDEDRRPVCMATLGYAGTWLKP